MPGVDGTADAGFDDEFDPNAIKASVSRLRRVLESVGAPSMSTPKLI